MTTMGKSHLELFEVFRTPKSPSPLFCHQEFLEKLAAQGKSAIGRRAAFLMQRLAVDAKRQHYKPTQGENRGWRRSRLGGSHGSHFYAWWAPRSAAPLKGADGFAEAPEGALFLRDIRHHDDHSLLSAQSMQENYLPVSVHEIRTEEYGPAPWTQLQSRFATGRQTVRVLKGHPGSGKTTALWNAADSAGAQRILYITYSSDLAGLARNYFDRYCSSHKNFQVITYSTFLRRLLGIDPPFEPLKELRRRFAQDASPIARTLGVWANSLNVLYDEFHAHLVGEALPFGVGRFAAAKQPRAPDAAYRERRLKSLGRRAVDAALDAAARLERADSRPLADRYFPELALAWRAVEQLRTIAAGKSQVEAGADLLDFDCLAVDEVQDLTPIEALALVQLAVLANKRRRAPVSVLLAGDEAQTVRPTDFEWGWLSDLLHFQVGTPQDYVLAANLRSPRRIAEIVNRVWDLYSWILKQERPRGIGQAEIDDDSSDQILYCSAVIGPELRELLKVLATREGLALITLEDSPPAFVPEEVRGSVITITEAKGLDFHTICLLDGGQYIGQIVDENIRGAGDTDISGLRKRLAIDQLRVALSRPTERLIWLDVNPDERVVRSSIRLLNGDDSEGGISSCVPAAVLKTLEEEELDPEERVQRCAADARQFLDVKPEMAWSRAQQAATLLGRPGTPAAVTDEEARRTTYLMLAEICCVLAFHGSRLPPEMGSPDLLSEACQAALKANRVGLVSILRVVNRILASPFGNDIEALADLAMMLPAHHAHIEPWLQVLFDSKSQVWVRDLEEAIFNGRIVPLPLEALTRFYEALGLPDHVARSQQLRQKWVQIFIKNKDYAYALEALRQLPERQPKMEGVCYEAMGHLRQAAESYRLAGLFKEALNCYRSIPDLPAALNMVKEMPDHPAAPSLEWMARLQSLANERPDKFTKFTTPAEKKYLEQLLEQALGVKRRKPAPRAPRAGKKPAAGKDPKG
jgi:hypothetical protein